jgi:hypothetical protein
MTDLFSTNAQQVQWERCRPLVIGVWFVTTALVVRGGFDPGANHPEFIGAFALRPSLVSMALLGVEFLAASTILRFARVAFPIRAALVLVSLVAVTALLFQGTEYHVPGWRTARNAAHAFPVLVLTLGFVIVGIRWARGRVRALGGPTVW